MLILLHLIEGMLLLVGVVSDPVLEYTGTQLTVNTSTVLQFRCSTVNVFLGCTIEFIVNRRTYDDIRSRNNTCHHKDGICQPERCECSDDCKAFTWNFTAMSDHVNSTFGCGSRIQENGKFYKANTSLQWTGSDFVILQKSFILLNLGIATTGFPIVKMESDQLNEGVFIAIIITISVYILCICIVIMIWCCQRRKKDSAQKKRDKDEKQVGKIDYEKSAQKEQEKDEKQLGKNDYEMHDLQLRESDDRRDKSKQICTVHEVRKSYENCNITEASHVHYYASGNEGQSRESGEYMNRWDESKQFCTVDDSRNSYENWNPSQQSVTENRVLNSSEKSQTSSNISVISSNVLIGKKNT